MDFALLTVVILIYCKLEQHADRWMDNLKEFSKGQLTQSSVIENSLTMIIAIDVSSNKLAERIAD